MPTEWMEEALRGPLRFRFFVQPLVALLLGLRDGRRDLSIGRAPFVIGVLQASGHRGEQLLAALRQVALPLVVAVALDAIVQASMLGSVRPLDALWVGALLVAFPYVAARGLSNRAIGRVRRRRPA